MEIHKKTRQRFTRAPHSGDIVLDAQGPTGLTQEKKTVIGGWTDYTGSGGVSSKTQMFFPVANKLEGTQAAIDGAKLPELGTLGEKTRNIRLRTKKLYVE